ncbi:diguanylate cyclase [Alicyclobacillus macrosporangiidus]|uniref:PAS domain S-box-containing protein/diguanylate cyclase (GGDEF) domain-containing protein n=1 Tax=Alicyclobacillus macrosporangiidus TaxID=392015 RepID=A0A1I7JHJ2_9BACL|nr:diguanylate cyclase [Alicyclobacillus macrosporangiidus]SFU84669.1 PAS domain S-box-containing protein/diguanylate cyclase (GGDEF) domain-containing protein [Alicyclobacillus macrosporangiidus]
MGLISVIAHAGWLALGTISILEFLQMRGQSVEGIWRKVLCAAYEWVPAIGLVIWIFLMDGVDFAVFPLYVLLMMSFGRLSRTRIINLFFILCSQVLLMLALPGVRDRWLEWACSLVALLSLMWHLVRIRIRFHPILAFGLVALVAFTAWVLHPDIARLHSVVEILVISMVFLFYVHDARVRRTIQRERERDPLTNLLNRRGGEEWLRRQTGSEGVAVLVDLDDFKFINDSFGHDAGDAVLREVARRLQSAAPEGSACIRWGGDEFLILISQPWSSAWRPRIERMYNAVTQIPVQLPGGTELTILCSMGVAWGRMSHQLIIDADRCLLSAKQTGKDRIGWVDADTAVRQVWSNASVYRFARAFDQLTRHTAVACIATDVHYNIVDVNPAFEALSGYTREQLIGKKPSMLAARGDFNRRRYPDIWASLEQHGRWEGKLCNQHPDGTVWWADTRMSAVRVGGVVVGYWSIVHKAEEGTVDVAARLSTFADQNRLPVLVVNREGRIKAVNSAFRDLYGTNLHECVEKRVDDIRSAAMKPASLNDIRTSAERIGVWFGVTVNEGIHREGAIPAVSAIFKCPVDSGVVQPGEDVHVELQVPLSRILQEWEQITGRSYSIEAIFLQTLAKVAEWGDPDLLAHVTRVSTYVRWLGKWMADNNLLTMDQVETIAVASITHDIGKVAIAREVLLKPHSLGLEEYGYVKAHALIGENILQTVLENMRLFDGRSRALIDCARVIAGTHHEWWDGSGYPRGLRETAIPLPGRMVAVADVLDALLSRRPYKQPWPKERVRRYMLEHRGTQFDPQIIDVLDAAWDFLPHLHEGSEMGLLKEG